MKILETPYDLTFSWNNEIYNGATISTDVYAGRYSRIYIPNSSGSSLTYNKSIYVALPYISLINIQHKNLIRSNNTGPDKELAWAFKYTSSNNIPPVNIPNLILICRSSQFTENLRVDSFWQAADSSFATNKQSQIQSSYNIKWLFPTNEFNVYETCMKVGNNSNYRIRVYVIPSILQIPRPASGSSTQDKCAALVNLSLIMDDSPFNQKEILLEKMTGNVVTSWDDVKKYIQVQKEGLQNNSNITPVSSPKKNFKCYTIDPNKDIIGDQITIDPATGQSLSEYLREDDIDELQSNTPAWLTVGFFQKYAILIVAVVGVALIIAGLVYATSIFIPLVMSDKEWTDTNWKEFKTASFVSVVCFIAIITLVSFSEKPVKEGFTNTIQETKDKRCYTSVTGRFIGTKITMLKGPNKGNVIVSYTQEECENQLGGHHKTESIEGGDVEPSSFSGPVGFCYSVDPKVVIPVSTQDYSVSICAPKVIKPPPPPPNLQCFTPSDSGTQLIGKEYKLSQLGLEKYKPLESIISYTQDECDRIGGLYKETVVPNTYVTDTSVKTNSLKFGFCYKWGTDLRNPTIDKKRNFSFLCSPSYVP
jgi:hypothetical protein